MGPDDIFVRMYAPWWSSAIERDLSITVRVIRKVIQLYYSLMVSRIKHWDPKSQKILTKSVV